MSFHFDSPHFLLLLLLLPLWWFIKAKTVKEASIVFSSNALLGNAAVQKSSNPSWLLTFLRFLAITFLILALARPQFSKGSSFIEASGIDILIAVDISSSMLALDFSTPTKAITRLSVAKKVTYDFIKKRLHDRIGLIAFSKEPYLVSPLTLNHPWVEQNLERLEIGLVPDGTAIGSAIAMALNRLKDLNSKSKIIILLTDGINNSGRISPITAAEMAASLNTKIYTIAIGRNGIVPTYHLDQNGQIAKTFYGKNDIVEIDFSVDEATLEKIAQMTGGQSFHAHNTKELQNIYAQIDTLEKTNVKLKQTADYKEIFAYPLMLGILLFFLEQLIAHTRLRRLP